MEPSQHEHSKSMLFEKALGPMAVAGWAAGFVLIFALLVSLLSSIRHGREIDDVNGALLNALSVLIVVWLLLRVHAPNALVRQALALHPIHFAQALASALLGAATLIPLSALQTLILKRWPLPTNRIAELTQALSALGYRERIAGVIAMTLLVPIMNELLFRGVLTSGLIESRDSKTALILTGIASGTFYSLGDYHHLPVFVLLGFLCGWARYTTGTVLGAIAVHCCWSIADVVRDFRQHHTLDPLITIKAPAQLISSSTVLTMTLVSFVLLAILYGLRRNSSSTQATNTPKISNQ